MASPAWRCPSARLCRTRPHTCRSSSCQPRVPQSLAMSRPLRLDIPAMPPPQLGEHAWATEIACMPSGRASSTFCPISLYELLGCWLRHTPPSLSRHRGCPWAGWRGLRSLPRSTPQQGTALRGCPWAGWQGLRGLPRSTPQQGTAPAPSHASLLPVPRTPHHCLPRSTPPQKGTQGG